MAHLKYPGGIMHLCRQRVVTEYTGKPHVVPEKKRLLPKFWRPSLIDHSAQSSALLRDRGHDLGPAPPETVDDQFDIAKVLPKVLAKGPGKGRGGPIRCQRARERDRPLSDSRDCRGGSAPRRAP